jgi:alpha-tubulin suppressor-like RCC1 family protein
MPEEQGTELYTWGQGVLGQLGHGDEKPQNQPRLIVSFLGTNVKSVSCGNQHTAVLLESGEVYSFGRGNFGQLGLGSLQVIPFSFSVDLAGTSLRRQLHSSVSFMLFALLI